MDGEWGCPLEFKEKGDPIYHQSFTLKVKVALALYEVACGVSPHLIDKSVTI